MVSILLAVYNGALSLSETLESIAQQTYTDWELIAIDDGSTDTSFSVLLDFQKQHPTKIQIYQNSKNLGLTKSLIIAATHARGEYLARIDAGDIFLKEKLDRQVRFLKTHTDHGIVGCNYINFDKVKGTEKKKNMPLTHEDIQSHILKKNPFAHSCILMKKNEYIQSGGYAPSVRYVQDYDLWFRMLSITKGANLPEYLCRRVIDTAVSIGGTRQKQQMWQRLKIQWRYMSKKNPLHYIYMLEPIGILVLPERIKKYLRHIL